MQLQLIYDEIAEKKRDKKDLEKQYKDALANTDEYEEIIEKIRELTDKRKGIEALVQTKLGKTWEKLEEIKDEVAEKKITMTDLAMNDLMAGKTVLIKDEAGNEYEPVWSVKFRKID